MKKRQHTVPRFYLRRFANEDGRRINVACRNTREVFSASISDVAVTKNIYSLPADGVLDSMALEDAFGDIESSVAPVVAGIDKIKLFNATIKSQLAPYLAAQLKRTTLVHEKHRLFEASVRDPQKVISYVQNNRTRYDRLLGVEEVDKFLVDVAAGRIVLRLTAAELMLQSQRNIGAYVEILADMTWCLVKSRAPVFITSDNPVFVRRRGIHDDTGLVGLERRDLGAELYCPLSPRTFLIANWDGSNPHRNPVGKPRAHELNRLTVCCSNKYVFGDISHEVLHLLKQHSGFRLELPTWDPEHL